MSPAGDAALLGDLRASMREREKQEDRILERIDDIVERLSRLEGGNAALQTRVEGVAKGVHDMRQELSEKGAFNPERLRAENAQLMRAISDESRALIMKQLHEDQKKRDEMLRWSLKVVISIGGAVAVAVSWAADRWDQLGVLVKLWRGGN